MKKTFFIFLACCLFSLFLKGQQVQYFNETYNNNSFFMKGFSIVDDGYDYVGYGATEDINVYQNLFFFKINSFGELALFKSFSEPNHVYYPGNVGGAMKKADDGSYVISFHMKVNGITYGRLMKLNQELDTIWTQQYNPEYKTIVINYEQTDDKGFCLTGWVWKSDTEYSDLLLIKTDSLGNFQWHKTYGGNWAEQGANAIQTPDGGYLIGGYFWKPGTDHSMDAIVIKTDSLGNEQWTKYFGNPDIDDDMAFVQMAGDGNYLVATVYGEWVHTSTSRTGRLMIYKLDTLGNIVSSSFKGPKRRNLYIKNFVDTGDEYLATGSSYTDTVSLFYRGGWVFKFNNNLDSVFRREYQHFYGETDYNFLYDVAPASDNGYIAIGQANTFGTQSNMWVIKLDSMGCDTSGCATGVFVEKFSPSRGGQGEVLTVYPNPATNQINILIHNPIHSGHAEPVEVWHDTRKISVFDIYGRKTKEITIPPNTETISINVQSWSPGLYFLCLIINGKTVGSAKVVVE